MLNQRTNKSVGKPYISKTLNTKKDEYQTSKNKTSEINFNASQKIAKPTGQSMSTPGLSFTIGSGALSGALSKTGVSSHSSIGIKMKKIKHGLFSSTSKKNLNEDISLEEKETSYQRSKNSSSSFNRGGRDMSGRSSKESLENISE